MQTCTYIIIVHTIANFTSSFNSVCLDQSQIAFNKVRMEGTRLQEQIDELIKTKVGAGKESGSFRARARYYYYHCVDLFIESLYATY